MTEKTRVLESLFVLAALRNIAPLYPEWRLVKFGYLGCGVSWLSFSLWHIKLKLQHIWTNIIKKYWSQGTNVQIGAMKSRFVCLQIRNKNLSMTMLRERYLRTELYSQKNVQICFQYYPERLNCTEILQNVPKNLTQPETKTIFFKHFSRRHFWADAWQRTQEADTSKT